MSDIVDAAYSGDAVEIRRLLDQGADVNHITRGQATLLNIVCEKGNFDAMSVLLEFGADANIEDDHKRIPLHFVSINGNVAALFELLPHTNNVNHRDYSHRSPLSYVAGSGNLAAFGELLPRTNEVNRRDSMSYAIKNGHIDIVRILLGLLGLSETPSVFDVSNAATNGHTDIVKILLDLGAGVDHENRDSDQVPKRRSPLSFAAEGGYTGIVTILLDLQASVDREDANDRTPLSYAAENGHTDIVTVLLDRQANVDREDAPGRSELLEGGRTPLSYAAENGHTDIVTVLLDRQASVDRGGRRKRTPLSYAAGNGHIATVSLLLNNQADVDAVDTNGETSLQWAKERKHFHVVTLLLRYTPKELFSSGLLIGSLIVHKIGDSNFRIPGSNPYNLSLDSYTEEGKMGMFFRYTSSIVVSFYYDDLGNFQMNHTKARAPICAGQGRVFYSRRGKVYENGIDLAGPENELCQELSSGTEKNWGCFNRTLDSPGDYFIVYSVIPLRIFQVKQFNHCEEVPVVQLEHARDSLGELRVKREYPNMDRIQEIVDDNRGSGNIGIFRGSTRGIQFEEGFLFVGHVNLEQKEGSNTCFPNWYTQHNHERAARQNYPRMYFMFFYTIKLNNGIYSISRISSCFHPPTNFPHKIVFPAGIAHGSNDSVLVSYGLWDEDCGITSYKTEDVNALLAPVESWHTNNYVFHPNYATSLRNSRRCVRSIWSTMLSPTRMKMVGTSPSTEKLFNPSIANVEGGTFITAWRKMNGDIRYWRGYNQVAMETCSLKINDEGKLVYSAPFRHVEFQLGTTTAGGEDPRLITDNDCPLLFVNDLDAQGNRRMYAHNLKTDQSALTVHPFCHDISRQNVEKNWGPFYVEGELHFVYSVFPLVIGKPTQFQCPSQTPEEIKCELIPHTRDVSDRFQGIFTYHGLMNRVLGQRRHQYNMRGGTPGIKLSENEYLFVGHSVQHSDRCFPDFIVQKFVENSEDEPWRKEYNKLYMAFFYTIEKVGDRFRLKRISCCSHFPGAREQFSKIVFPSGLAKANLGGDLEDAFVVSFGVKDTHGVFCALNRRFLEYVLRPVEHWDYRNYVVDVNYFQSVLNLNPTHT